MMGLNVYLKGLATYVPGFYPQLANLFRPPRTGGTDSARYCYSVWLRHLVMASRNGLSDAPRTVAELGPGDSLGTGLAALLLGADTYYAFDVVPYATNERNLQMVDELVHLFRSRAPIPADAEFPGLQPRLGSYDFPLRILSESRLSDALSSERVSAIRRAVKTMSPTASGGIRISYRVPWDEADVIVPHSVDLVYSQAVLEHVDNLQRTYHALFQWLKPDGYMSHTVDFRSHGTAKEWNGHWAYSDLEWKVVHGRRRWLLNRKPHSAHLSFLRQSGFRIVSDLRQEDTAGLERRQLARSFRTISDEDLSTCGAFIQAVPDRHSS
jgi:SAM-dependent methyltransferase